MHKKKTESKVLLYTEMFFSKGNDSILIIADEQELYYIGFSQQKKQALSLFEGEGYTMVEGTSSVLQEAEKQLAEYMEGKRKGFSLPLHIVGTDFQKKVWQALCTIEYGQTWSYKQLAQAVGSPNAYRAAGSANGANRFSIVIPCHRVVAYNGTLGGYGGGLENKTFLLDLEKKNG